MALKGRTVILSIHQPRSAIFKLFDRLLLLDNGGVAYDGPANEAVQYFADIGYPCEQFSNPAGRRTHARTRPLTRARSAYKRTHAQTHKYAPPCAYAPTHAHMHA